ncbi:MAG: helix-turn-helix transcriptional regulator [Caldilineales bacterium]
MKNYVRLMRETRGWSQEEFAGMLGVSRQTVSSIENGRYHPSLPLAFRIAAAFGLVIEELFEPEE